MTSDLLKCIICPKKPNFSDVSHLLTHIGSKGHLAHLHGLQVRSHQEIDAGKQLTIYNQWFQEHEVAALLSERMQQKEQKQADKKAANRRRVAATTNGTKSRSSEALQTSQNASTTSAYSTERLSTIGTEDIEDPDKTKGTPIGIISQYPSLDSSPTVLCAVAVDNDTEYIDDSGTVHVNDTAATILTGATRLKGTQWPGMALFDAAPEELKRKRNQRKDGSVLQKLERNASLVKPTETVHSATGTVLKYRHMDDLENDSPVEGEEVIILPSPRKRKSKLPRASGSTLPQRGRRSGRPRRQYTDTPSKVHVAGTDAMSGLTRQLSIFEDESKEVKHPMRSFGQKRRSKKAAFAIYEDSSPPLGLNGPMERDTDPVRSQVAFGHTFLPRQMVDDYDPFMPIGHALPTTHLSFAAHGQGKENDPNSFFSDTFNTSGQVAANPLLFYPGDTKLGAFEQHTSGNPLNPIFASHIDPFSETPTRNPLMVAMDQLNGTEPGIDPFAAHMLRRQPLFAPR